MKNLVIFDIDGTLIHSHADEVTCFIQAFNHVMGEGEINTDLTSYQHVTDNGIAIECVDRLFQRSPLAHELTAIENTFLSLFDKALTLNPPRAIAGAHDLFKNLRQEKDLCLAIATGSYYGSALLKLKHANLLLSDLPLACCDEHIARIEIMKNAKTKAHHFYQIADFHKVTYVGDGPWDVKASKTLAWHFIGIASNYSPDLLKTWGANVVIDDYLNHRQDFKALI